MNRFRLGKAVLSAAVVLGLGFGAREAAAWSPTPDAAMRPYCEDDADCEQTCQLMYGPNARGLCSSGHTCYCSY